MKKTWKKAATVLAFAGIALSATACSGGKAVVTYKGGKITILQQDEGISSRSIHSCQHDCFWCSRKSIR